MDHKAIFNLVAKVTRDCFRLMNSVSGLSTKLAPSSKPDQAQNEN